MIFSLFLAKTLNISSQFQKDPLRISRYLKIMDQIISGIFKHYWNWKEEEKKKSESSRERERESEEGNKLK